MKRRFYIWVIAVWLLNGCQTAVQTRSSEVANFNALTVQLLKMISDRSTTQPNLTEAIARLGKPTEGPEFWRRIVNDPSYPAFHRRECAETLFRRYGRAAGTIGDLAEVLDQPPWITESDIQIVTFVVGVVPVELNADDTVFRILIRFGSESQKSAAYVRVRGKVSLRDFDLVVLKGAKLEVSRSLILQTEVTNGYD